MLRGKVIRFELAPPLKVPHMGWNRGAIKRHAPVLEGVADGTYFYFVHSYYVVPEDAGLIAIESEYGHPFCAAVWRDNLFAVQFRVPRAREWWLSPLMGVITGVITGATGAFVFPAIPYMAALEFRTRSVDAAWRTMESGGVIGMRRDKERVIVPAAAACGATLAFCL